VRRVLVTVGLIGCSDPAIVEPDGGPPPGPAAAVLRVPRGGEPAAAFYDLPYPSDLRLVDGRVDLTGHPRPNAIVGDYLDAITAGQRGFGRASAIYLRFDGDLDPGSLPATAADATAEDAGLYLVDVDPDSPRRGRRVPIDVRLATASLEVIAAPFVVLQPVPGVVLDDATTYAVVATRRLRATDGSPVAAPPDLAAIAGDAAPAEPVLAAAQAAYQPLLAWLDEPGGDERADLVSATVFTTQDASGLLGRIRAVIHRDVPAPRPIGLKYQTERDGYVRYEGSYDGPLFQAGESPFSSPDQGGSIELDAAGDPIVQGSERLRFALTLPVGPRPAAGWPVVLYAHGTGGDYRSFIGDGTARRLAAAGLACISIDQVLHGIRNTQVPPELAFFNYQNPYAARDNTLQGALDDFQLVRLVLGFDWTERHPGGRTIRFDPERIYFFGHSQGSLTGIPFVAHEPAIRAAVFSGAGGLLYQALLHKTEPLDIPGLLELFIRDQPLDRFHPVINLLQAYMERADSAAYAARLVGDGTGATPSVFVSEGLIDRYTPIETIEALAVALRLDLVGPVLREVPGLVEAGGAIVAPPLRANRGDATFALLQYQEVAGSDGHFVVFDVPAAERQSIEFLRTMAETGLATVVTP
jgi:dienelactone hydrolase